MPSMTYATSSPAAMAAGQGNAPVSDGYFVIVGDIARNWLEQVPGRYRRCLMFCAIGRDC